MSNRKILVVDDEVAIRDMFEQAFGRAGYLVRSVEDAEEALEVLKNEDIHLMFLDLKLPGMNGVELCRQLRKNRPMDVVYALTGYASLFDFEDCRKAGFDYYFNKRVDLKILLRAAQDGFEKIDRLEKNISDS